MNRIYTNPTGSNFVEFSADAVASAARKDLSTEIATRTIDGTAWLNLYQVLPNPDPVLRKTGNSVHILDEIRREQHVSACATSRESGVQKRKWKIEPGKASARAAEVAGQIFSSINMRTFKSDVLQAIGYGYQVSEIIWQREGNLLLPEKIVGKPQRWFMFGKENELRMKTSPADFTGQPVEPYKFLLTQFRASYDNPYGEAQYSLCFWPVIFKKGGLRSCAKFLEKFGMPHVIGKLPENANAAERGNLLSSLTRLIQDACATIPDNASVDLLEMSNVTGSSDVYLSFIGYHDGQISTVLLGHSAAATSTPGKLGNENMAFEARADIIDGDCDMIQETAGKLLRMVHELNPSLGTEVPTLELYSETQVETDRADRDLKVSQIGQVEFTEQYFERTYDYQKGDIRIVPKAQPSQFPPEPPPQFSSGAAQAPALASSSGQEAIDNMENAVGNAAMQAQMETALKPVFGLIEKARDYGEVRAGVAKLFPAMDTTEIERTIEKAMFMGETAGRTDNPAK